VSEPNPLVARWMVPPHGPRAAVWDACRGACHYCGAELHPVIVAADGELIAGEWRLRA